MVNYGIYANPPTATRAFRGWRRKKEITSVTEQGKSVLEREFALAACLRLNIVLHSRRWFVKNRMGALLWSSGQAYILRAKALRHFGHPQKPLQQILRDRFNI